jgi:hypothetical protein
MQLVYKIIAIIVFVSVLIVIIAIARGYRIDFQKKSLTSTGILSVNSSPKAAKIYINNELKDVTDANITLPHGTYTIDIKKEGYTNWSKTVSLKGELVVSTNALLFPLNPSLSPLTNLGIVKAIPLDQTERILLFSDNGDIEKDGIYIFEAGKKSFSFLPQLKNIVLKNDFPDSLNIDFKTAVVSFSPDYSQAIVEFPLETGESYAYLLSLDEQTKAPLDVSASKETLISAWEIQKEKNNLKILETFPKEMVKIASESFKIIAFSPDKTKILYTPKTRIYLTPVITPPLIAANQTPEDRSLVPNNLYVYDKKEDKNFNITSQIENWKLEIENFILWYSDSKHFIFKEQKKITAIEYDGTNKQVVYSGPFENSFFTTTLDGKIIVLTNLNPENNKYPDLYLVGIR